MKFPPAIQSLEAAVRLAIKNGSDLSQMKLDRWAATYPPATVETIRATWERVLSDLSQHPINSFEENE